MDTQLRRLQSSITFLNVGEFNEKQCPHFPFHAARASPSFSLRSALSLHNAAIFDSISYELNSNFGLISIRVGKMAERRWASWQEIESMSLQTAKNIRLLICKKFPSGA